MKKRLLCLVLCLVMMVSVFPIGALAESDLHPAAATDNPTVQLEKYLTENSDGTYDLTLEAFAKGAFVESETTVSSALDVVLVLDQSLSMRSNDLRSGYIEATRQDWTIAQAADSGVQYYYQPAGSSAYFAVHRGAGSLQYTAYSNKYVDDSVIESGMDPYNLTNNWAYSKTSWYTYYDGGGDVSRAGLRSVYVMTKGYTAFAGKYSGGWYTRFFYFKDEDINAVPTFSVGDKTDSVENMLNARTDRVYLHSTSGSTQDEFRRAQLSFGNISDSFHLRETVYKQASQSGYDHLYYTDANGNEQLIGRRAAFDVDTVYQGKLYYSVNGGSRLETMKTAVSAFAKSLADSAEKNEVEHKLAIVGFGGGQEGYDYPKKTTTYTNPVSGKTETITANTIHRLGDNQYAYVNTGFFVENGQFLNYQSVTGYTNPSVFNSSSSFSHLQYRSINGVWTAFRNTSHTSSAQKWQNIETTNVTSKDGGVNGFNEYNFYDPDFAPQSTAAYQSALFSVRQNDTGSYSWNGTGSLVKPSESATLTKSNEANGVNDHVDQAIAMVDAYGESYLNHGLTMARNIFKANPDTETRKARRVVVVFTDGHVGTDGEYDAGVMGEALSTSDLMKQDGITVYTIGLFNKETNNQMKENLNHMSSNDFSLFSPTNQVTVSGDEATATYYVYNAEGEFVAVTPRYHDDTFLNTSNYIGFWGKRTDNGRWTFYIPASRSDKASENYPVFYDALKSGSTYYSSAVNKIANQSQCTQRQYYVPDNGASSSSGASAVRIPVYYGYLWQDSNENSYFPTDSGDNYMETACGGKTTQFYEKTGSVDRNLDTDFYIETTDIAELNDAFSSVSESVEEISTAMTLDADDSVLRDVLTNNFILPEGFAENPSTYVTAETVPGSVSNGTYTFNESGKQTLNVTMTYTPNTDTSAASENVAGTLDISGFDYTGNFIAEGNPGKMLRVTIRGLTPAHPGICYSNAAESGVYKHDLYNDKHVAVAYFPRPYVDVEDQSITRIADFNAPLLLAANAVFNPQDKSVQENVKAGINGAFTLEAGGNLTYRFNASNLSDGKNSALLLLGGMVVDSATIKGQVYDNQGKLGTDSGWQTINVIPANSIYFDDDFAAQTVTMDGSGYNAELANKNTTTSATVAKGESISFTFSGSRIDVYCTTDSSKDYVKAILTDNNTGETKRVNMGNQYTSGTLYNVPTVSFSGLDNTHSYTLVISDLTADSYRLDGVRIYDPVNKDVVVGGKTVDDIYKELGEQNATFTQVRQMLIEQKAFASAESGLTGAVYLDTMHSGGQPADYAKIGPKNEVYLAKDQAIAFMVDTTGYTNPKIMLGLSAPEGNGAVASVSSGDGKWSHSIHSVTDMYYLVEPSESGCVVVQNAGDGLLAVTNVKITEGNAQGPARTPSFQMNKSVLMSYVAAFEELETVEPTAPVITEPAQPEATPSPEPTVEPSAEPSAAPTTAPTPVPTKTPTIRDVAKQIFSSFVNALFGGIARLFGK